MDFDQVTVNGVNSNIIFVIITDNSKKHLQGTGNYDNIIFGSCAAVAELADALDSKSSGKPCRFESGQRHLQKLSEWFRELFFCP